MEITYHHQNPLVFHQDNVIIITYLANFHHSFKYFTKFVVKFINFNLEVCYSM